MTVRVTDELLGELVASSWAEGIFALGVAAAIEHDEKILLIGPSGNDFDPIWQLPSGLVLPGETLFDALGRMISLTSGLNLRDVTGYDGHHDRLMSDEVVRTFVFNVTVGDPTRICESAYIAHRWSSEPITDSLVVTELHRSLSAHSTKPAQPGFNRSTDL
jgi:ADP-ribose pyrophosphatase YjhB (NUDIX family)